MKLKSLLSASFIIPAAVSAQITIQGTSLNAWVPADTIRDLTNVNAAITTNGTWDLTTGVYSPGTFGTTDKPGTHASFPSATFTKAISYGLGSIGYIAEVYGGKDNNGVYWYGEEMDRQAYSIASITANTQDSLVFPGQVITYSVPEKFIAFPMSFNGNWNNTLNYTTAFELTVTMYGLNKTPGERRTRLEVRDSVKGWGKMRLNDLNGNPSGYMDVLVVQEREYAIDSFYLGGNPAPPTLLAAFGLTQGQVAPKFTTKFFRSGEVTPLLRLVHDDSTFTTSTGKIAMVNRLAPPVNGISNIAETNTINVYPNPVAAGGLLHVNGLAQGSNWTYTFTSLNGQVIHRGTLQAGDVTVKMPESVSGIYAFAIFKDGVSQGSQLVIVK